MSTEGIDMTDLLQLDNAEIVALKERLENAQQERDAATEIIADIWRTIALPVDHRIYRAIEAFLKKGCPHKFWKGPPPCPFCASTVNGSTLLPVETSP